MQERREELQIEGEKAKRYHVLWNGEIVGQHFDTAEEAAVFCQRRSDRRYTIYTGAPDDEIQALAKRWKVHKWRSRSV